MKVAVKLLSETAKLPVYATKGAAAFDISASERSYLPAMGSVKLKTGLAFEIPEGYVMLVFSRSGHGFSKDIRLANCVGVIDSDYRGELGIKLTADDFDELRIEAGDRIAQGMVLPVEQVSFTLVEELSTTERGDGGFGSTGVR